MNSQHDDTENANRFRLNANSSATLVDLSETPDTDVDVISRESAISGTSQPITSAREENKTNEFPYHAELNGEGGQTLDNLWTRVDNAPSQALCTPKANRFELADTPSQTTNNTSTGLISPGLSRQLPPLPHSPPIPSSYDIFGVLVDAPPTRATLASSSVGNIVGSEGVNVEPSRWLFQNAQPASSLQGVGSIALESSPPIDHDNDNNTDQSEEEFDSQWAKHMEERSRRISDQQRERNLLFPRAPDYNLLSSNQTPNRGSSRVSEETARRERAISGWRQRTSEIQQRNHFPFGNLVNENETDSSPNVSLPPLPVPPPTTSSRSWLDRISPARPPAREPQLDAWRRRLQERAFQRHNERPDIQSRNTALDTISNILFNFDCPPDEVAGLLEDTCATANEVGVSTGELLAQTVSLGNFDLGMTPLCLEASRCDLSAGIDVLIWLLENVFPGSIEKDLRRGCLMRNNGMGDQIAWSTMKIFVPEQENQAIFSYDVSVDNIFLVPGAAGKNADSEKPDPQSDLDEDSDQGSLYDDASLIDAESSLNQADIETLKSSDDEGEPKPSEPTASDPPMGPRSTVHRARIDIPYFESSLKLEDEHILPAYTALPYWQPGPSKLSGEPATSSKYYSEPTRAMPMKKRVLTSEWMHEGRVWALAIGENKLVLTLRHVSEVVAPQPINVKAFIRIFPADVLWSEVEELTSIGPDRLLPTQSGAELPLTPVYSCEFDEVPLVPGPPALPGNTSVCKEDIYMSRLSLLDLLGPSGAMKVETIIKTSEMAPATKIVRVSSPDCQMPECQEEKGKGKGPESVSGESDADWQQVNF